MTLESSFGSASARVNAALLTRDRAAPLGQEGALVLAPIAPPRLWEPMSRALTDAMLRALENQPIDANLPGRCAEYAGRALRHYRDRLIETHLTLDVHLVVAVVTPRVVHLAITGGVSALRVRRGTFERLLPGAEGLPSLAGAATPWTAAESLEPGESIILATTDVLSMRALGALQSLLGREPDTGSSKIRETLLGPARESERGGAVAVLRAR
jgi:hypothetical protein